MKAIIKSGKYSHIHTCSNCECVFTFTKKDCIMNISRGNVKIDYNIICPECGKKDFVLLEKDVN